MSYLTLSTYMYTKVSIEVGSRDVIIQQVVLALCDSMSSQHILNGYTHIVSQRHIRHHPKESTASFLMQCADTQAFAYLDR